MGASESVPSSLSDPSFSWLYPPSFVDRLRQLSVSSSVFLRPDPDHDLVEFDLEHWLPRLQKAIAEDRYIAQWYPILVPRKSVDVATS